MEKEKSVSKRSLVLLVDDNEEILEFVSDDLSEHYEVITAMNGAEALQIILEKSVHIIVSDIMMPVMDGLELCQNIKSNFEFSHVPVILLTAKNTLQSKIEGLELGADAYIEKPFSPEHLQVQIANLLSNRDKIKSYFASLPLTNIRSMAHSKADETFLEQVNDIIENNLTDQSLDVEQLASAMHVSRPTLYRKTKALTDLTPYELINVTRLKKAAELLGNGRYRIYEVADLVGYSSQNQLGRNFLRQFGLSPSAYISENSDKAK